MNRISVAIASVAGAAIGIIFAGESWPILLVGGGLTLAIAIALLLTFDPGDSDVDAFWLKKWIYGAHAAHGGSYGGFAAFPIEICTEPECEEGRTTLERLKRFR